MKLPVNRRAEIPRTVAIVVALLPTAVMTNALSREFRAADTRREDYPTVQAPRCMSAIDPGRTNVALLGTLVPAMNVLAMPFLFHSIGPMRKVVDGAIGNAILDSFEPVGFVGLAFDDSGARSSCPIERIRKVD